MKILGYSNAAEVARLVASRLFDSEDVPFSLVLVDFGHNALDNWYVVRFFKRVSRCEQNCAERDVCEEMGYIYA